MTHADCFFFFSFFSPFPCVEPHEERLRRKLKIVKMSAFVEEKKKTEKERDALELRDL